MLKVLDVQHLQTLSDDQAKLQIHSRYSSLTVAVAGPLNMTSGSRKGKVSCERSERFRPVERLFTGVLNLVDRTGFTSNIHKAVSAAVVVASKQENSLDETIHEADIQMAS